MTRTKKTKRVFSSKKSSSSTENITTEETLSSCRNDATSEEVREKIISNRTAIAISLFFVIVTYIFSNIYQDKNMLYHPISNKSKLDDLNITENEKVDQFIKWFELMGGWISPHVTLGEFSEYGGFGLVATHHAGRENTSFAAKGTSSEQCARLNEESCERNLGGVQYNQEMFTVPKSIIISMEGIFSKYSAMSHSSFRKEDAKKALSSRFAIDSMVSQDIIIALELMVQCSLGSKSSHYPYLQVLPNHVPRLDTFSDQELAELQDTQLEDLGIQSRNNLKNAWEKDGFDIIVERMRRDTLSDIDHGVTFSKKIKLDMTSQTAEVEKCMSFESFLKYVAIVSSRAMVLHGTKFLTPLADMINHSPRSEHENYGERAKTATAASKIQYFTKYHQRREDGSIVVRSDRHTLPGEQILENYGELDNSLFLEAHGFVPFQNPSHCAILSITHFPPFYSLPSEMRNVMLNLRLVDVNTIETQPSEKSEDVNEAVDENNQRISSPLLPPVCVRADGTITDRLSEAFVSVLGLLDAQPQDINTTIFRQRCYEADKRGDFEHTLTTCVYYNGHRERILHVVQNVSQKTLNSVKTSLKDDMELLRGTESKRANKDESNITEAYIVALKFRIEEKKVLQKVAALRPTCTNNNVTYHQDYLKRDKKEARDLSRILDNFNEFVMYKMNFPVRKVEAKISNHASMRLGAFATDDIRKDEIYLSVPSEWILSVEKIKEMIEHRSDSGNNDFDLTFRHIITKYSDHENNDFIALLLFLMHERFVEQSESKWWPYLNILPTFDELKDNVPLFFSQEEINQFLPGSDLRNMIFSHQNKVNDKFNYLLSDQHVTSNIFLGRVFTYDNFRWAHAILDSRSIWWDNKRHLVPLLDMVNCNDFGVESLGDLTKDNDYRVHSTTIDKSGKNAQTRSPRALHRGEQLFENYGQPNHVYFLYHGFILENNSHDCAILNEIYISAKDEGAKDIEMARNRLSSIGVHTFSPSFCIRDGDSLHHVADFLRVKHSVDTRGDDGKGINSLAIRDRVRDVLEGRLMRYDNIDDVDMKMNQPCLNNTQQPLSYSQRNMIQIVKNEYTHFANALRDLMSIKIANTTSSEIQTLHKR